MDKTSSLAIHAAYRGRLSRALKSPKHAGLLPKAEGLERIEVSCDGVMLAALINPSTHTVEKAMYGDTGSSVQRGLLEALCGIMVGRPIQECADHAAIWLEFALRDPSATRPVPGIVSPDNADPAFRLPGLLVRGLAERYRTTTGTSRAENSFDPPASPAWLMLSWKERIQRIQNALKEMIRAVHLSPDDITVVALDNDNRIVLDVKPDMASRAKGALVMRIEAYLKRHVEEKLHVYTTERKDLNKIRRLSTSDPESPTTTD